MTRIIDNKEMNLIGDNVRKYRKLRKMSQQKLSNKLELSGIYVCRGSISRIEDKTRTITDIELFAIAEALSVEIKDYITKSNLIKCIQNTFHQVVFNYYINKFYTFLCQLL